MDSRDTQSYQEVHTIDEGIRSSLKRFLGRKKKEVESPKPMSRGEVLRQRYNVGPEKSDTSAKRQILDRSRARAERDEEKYGGSVYTKKVADKSKEAHDRYLKAGYSKYGADLKHGRGSKAAKRAAALNREEFDFILYHLVNEGYANNLKGAEVIASNMSEEWVESILDETTLSAKAARAGKDIGAKGKNFAKIAASAGERYGSAEAGKRVAGAILKKMRANEEFESWVDSLLEEGYDLSDYTMDEMFDIYLDEAEGSYGATPKAYSAASKTKMTAKRKPFLKKMLSRTNPANRTSPYGSPRKGMSDEDRERARAGSKHGVGTRQEHDYPSEGPGGVTKSAKKLRKQKAMGEFGESN